MDVADNKIAIDDKGFEVKFVGPWQVASQHFVRKQTAPLTGFDHAWTMSPILGQVRPIDEGR
jgi:hypothetical protein